MAVPKRYAFLTLLLLGVAIVASIRPGAATDPTPSVARMPATTDTVVRVVDGDTVVLRSAGTSRLIGVDTPEVSGRRECFGAEAWEFAKSTLRAGLRVRIQRDVEPRDRYGRTLIYLSLPDGRSFNELLVDEGFAVPLTIPPNVRYATRLQVLASRARDEQAGLWAPSTCNGRTRDSS